MTTKDYQIIKRTFEAEKHPKGSEIRKTLNADIITSEYYHSRKYVIIGDHIHVAKKSRKEAELYVQFLESAPK